MIYSINFFTFLQKKNISENKIIFENFSIPKNNIITVELALFGRDQVSHKLIKEVKIRLWLV
jgi:hypothetical protein